MLLVSQLINTSCPFSFLNHTQRKIFSSSGKTSCYCQIKLNLRFPY